MCPIWAHVIYLRKRRINEKKYSLSFYSIYLELGMKNEEDEEEKSHLIEVTPVIEFEKLDKGNYFKNIAYSEYGIRKHPQNGVSIEFTALE